jgi:hypothetical protein
MKTWQELIKEIDAIKKVMRIEGEAVFSVTISNKANLVMRKDGLCLVTAAHGHECTYLGYPDAIYHLSGLIIITLEAELARLRAQAGDELKTLALIAAGATP